MAKVVIDGIEYVPKTERENVTDDKITKCLAYLVEIQYFHECTNKHRAWAWDAINALDPSLAKLVSEDPQAAMDLFIND